MINLLFRHLNRCTLSAHPHQHVIVGVGVGALTPQNLHLGLRLEVQHNIIPVFLGGVRLQISYWFGTKKHFAFSKWPLHIGFCQVKHVKESCVRSEYGFLILVWGHCCRYFCASFHVTSYTVETLIKHKKICIYSSILLSTCPYLHIIMRV